MSIKIMSLVWEQATVGGSELLVLLALADYGNDEGCSIYPSMQSLANKARLSVDQTRRVIHKLIANGNVELVEQGGWDGKRNRANEYRIVMDARGVLANCKGGTGTDARGGTRADASTVLAPVQDQPLYNHHEQPPLHSVPATQDAAPKPLSDQQEMFAAICEVIGWDYKTLSKADAGQVAQCIGVLSKADYTVADIRTFMTDVWFKDWRWTKHKQHPTIKQLRQEIGKTRSLVKDAAPKKGMQGYREMLAKEGIQI